MTRNIKIILSYDGTNYYGWQRQGNLITIQQVLEESIAKMTREPVRVIGSGRTDTGVHALKQVAHFKTKSSIPERNFLLGINGILPKDIVIKELVEVDNNFHARLHAKSKIYLYRIWNQRIRPIFEKNYAWFISAPLDIMKMNAATSFFKGMHDFTSFCAVHNDAPDHIRTIIDIGVKKSEEGIIEIEVEADGFLRYMVRNIVGTIVCVGNGKYQPEDIIKIMEAKDRRCAGIKAPAHGLFLKEVKY
jgi:tRNA pseudouridine38-40 synthase